MSVLIVINKIMPKRLTHLILSSNKRDQFQKQLNKAKRDPKRLTTSNHKEEVQLLGNKSTINHHFHLKCLKEEQAVIIVLTCKSKRNKVFSKRMILLKSYLQSCFNNSSHSNSSKQKFKRILTLSLWKIQQTNLL